MVKARVTILSREHPPGRREAVVAHTASAAASAAGEDTPVVAHMAPSAAEVAAVGDTLEEATVSLAMHRQEGNGSVEWLRWATTCGKRGISPLPARAHCYQIDLNASITCAGCPSADLACSWPPEVRADAESHNEDKTATSGGISYGHSLRASLRAEMRPHEKFSHCIKTPTHLVLAFLGCEN